MASFGRERNELLSLHPTTKPVRMLADAILDASKRGDTVLDSFLGSGSTLLACDEVGRRCFGVEIDPLYVDVAVRRCRGPPAATRSSRTPARHSMSGPHGALIECSPGRRRSRRGGWPSAGASTYKGSISTPKQRRPTSSQASDVEPLPKNKSSTVSPRSKRRGWRRRACGRASVAAGGAKAQLIALTAKLGLVAGQSSRLIGIDRCPYRKLYPTGAKPQITRCFRSWETFSN